MTTKAVAAHAPANGLAAARPGEADRLPHRPRDDSRGHVVRDVEGLDVPGVALLEPVGQAVDDDQQDHQLGRQQQRARHDEEDRRMEDAAAVEVEREELRDRGQHGERDEQAPVDRLDVVCRDEDPDRRRCDDRRPVEPGPRRQRSDTRPAQPRRPASGLDRRCAHGLPFQAEAAELTAAVAAGIVVTLTPFIYACEERFLMAEAARVATQALPSPLADSLGRGDEAAVTAWGGRKVGPARVIGIPRRR